eukprot:1157534-Pelagomonas_calceolata.AAC.1
MRSIGRQERTERGWKLPGQRSNKTTCAQRAAAAQCLSAQSQGARSCEPKVWKLKERYLARRAELLGLPDRHGHAGCGGTKDRALLLLAQPAR